MSDHKQECECCEAWNQWMIILASQLIGYVIGVALVIASFFVTWNGRPIFDRLMDFLTRSF